MLLDILLAVLIVVCLSLVGVILLQRSEGGALGMSGGGPGAFMTARGTGDLLTRATQILAGVFFALCLAMTLISGHERGQSAQVQKLKGLPTPVSSAPASSQPTNLPSGALNPFAAPAPVAPAPTPFGAQPNNNNSINLLGNPQVPLSAPQARPPVAVPRAAPATAKVIPPKPVRVKTTPPAATTAAPIVAPAPVTLPPPAPAAPTNGQ